MDESAPGVLSPRARWAIGNSGSGGFFDRRSLKKGLFEGVFFGVDKGLTSDLDDSDGRFERAVSPPAVPFECPVADEYEMRGDTGSSNGDRDGRRLSSVDCFRKEDFSGWPDELL